MTALEGAEAAMAGSASDLRRLPKLHLRRPMPDDFLAVAPGKTDSKLVEIYRAARKAVERWRAEAGLSEVVPLTYEERRHPVPADFETLARTMHKMALARHYGLKVDVISRMLDRLGIEAQRPPLAGNAKGLPVPADFAARSHGKTLRELALAYGRHTTTISRWLDESGLRAKRQQAIQYQPIAKVAPATDGSVVGEAAHFLRRSFVVYRCDVRPRVGRAHLPNEGKGLWFVGGKGAIPADEVIALAESKGFDRRAWARI